MIPGTAADGTETAERSDASKQGTAPLAVLSSWFGTGSRGTAADRLLDNIVAAERDRSTMVVCWIRLALAWLNAAVVFPPEHVEGYLTVWPSRYGSVLYAVMATVVLVVARRWPAARKYAALAPALLDVPFAGGIEYLQAGYATAPGIGSASTVAMLLGFVMLSTLSLSRVVVTLVMVPTLVFTWAILTVGGIPLEIRVQVVVVSLGFGGLGWVLVGKIRSLVRTSRERDLLGKYVLGERLGSGGMAEVFTATYCPEGGFERRVAVKRILPAYAESGDALALFRREAELGARLAHPNVVQVLDFGSHGDTHFLAMEYVDGVSLGRVLGRLKEQGQRLPAAALVYLAAELAEALKYVHSRVDAQGQPMRLVHRDLNPPNILLSRIGEVKLADFGIAWTADRPALTEDGAVRGKLGYAAPEQIRGEPLDGRADLFSLGVTLCEAMTLQRLFTGPGESGAAQAVLNAPLPDLAVLRPDVPSLMLDLVTRLLVRDRAMRLQSASELATWLGTLAQSLDAAHVGRSQLIEAVRNAAGAPPGRTGKEALSGSATVPLQPAGPREPARGAQRT